MGTEEHLLEQLNKVLGSNTLILGIGNTLKGDDGAGPLVCEQLRGRVCAEIIDAGTVPENYIQPIVKKAPQNLLIVDAIDLGASPGTISVLMPEQLNSSVFSTHALSPRLFVDVILQNLEVDVYFVGIQPAQTTIGKSVSPAVNQAIQRLSGVLSEIFAPG